jgi:hypothetical protein
MPASDYQSFLRDCTKDQQSYQKWGKESAKRAAASRFGAIAELPQNPLVKELLDQARARSKFSPPFQPTNATAEVDATNVVNGWSVDRDIARPKGPAMFGINMSVFMLKRDKNGFAASLEIPSEDGKSSTKGAVWLITNLQIDGKRSTYPALSGKVWTPRTATIGKLDLSGSERITARADFSFAAYTASPAVFPFANGYAVNLFGQEIMEDGTVNGAPKGNYVTDDGRPLYGRLIWLDYGGKVVQEQILSPSPDSLQYAPPPPVRSKADCEAQWIKDKSAGRNPPISESLFVLTCMSGTQPSP